MKFEYLGGPKSEERMLLSMVMDKLSVWGEGKIASVALKLVLVKQKDAQRLAVSVVYCPMALTCFSGEEKPVSFCLT